MHCMDYLDTEPKTLRQQKVYSNTTDSDAKTQTLFLVAITANYQRTC
jgi:hypothetical protein